MGGEPPVAEEADAFGYRADGWSWPVGHIITYRTTGVTGANIVPAAGSTQGTIDQVNAAALRAMNTWKADSHLSFLFRSSGAVDIEIKFGTMTTSSHVAETGETSHDITISKDRLWSVEASLPSGRYDLEAVLLHELGHSIGLWHSSAYDSVMEKSVETSPIARRSLSVDDKVAVSRLYDQWTYDVTLPNGVDVGTGADGSVWVVSVDQIIRKWNGSTYDGTECCGSRIAVEPSGKPWVVAPNGTIWRRLSATAGTSNWSQITGCATDIGIGGSSGSGVVYVLGCGRVAGGYDVYKFVNGAFQPIPQGGSAVRISVNRNGYVWVANEYGDVYSLGTPVNSVWTYQGEGAADIAVGPVRTQVNSGLGDIDYAFVLAFDQKVWSYNVQYGNEFNPSQFWPSVNTWWQLSDPNALGTSIAVASNGTPWTAGASAGGVRHPRR
jgi:hypothetical protein